MEKWDAKTKTHLQVFLRCGTHTDIYICHTHRHTHTHIYIYISMYPDVVFGYLMARILHQFNHLLHDRDVLSEIPEDHGPCLFAQPTSESHDHMTFAGPVWMGDVALCLWGATDDAVASKLGVACGTRLDLFREHAMSPNLSKGKTELMFSTKGPKTNAWKKRLYGPLSTGFFPILGGPKPIRCPLSPAMRTWEAPLLHAGSSRPEARRRIAIANTSFNQHRKLVFQNQFWDLQKRAELFNSLVISKLCYAAETWVLDDWETREYTDSAIMRLYKRLLKVADGTVPISQMMKFCVSCVSHPPHSDADRHRSMLGAAQPRLNMAQTASRRSCMDVAPAVQLQ